MPGIQCFFVPGPLPGLNDLLGWAKSRGDTHGRKGKRWNSYAEQKRVWEEAIFVVIRNEKISPYPGAIFVNYLWQEPNRKRDPSNIAAAKKLVEDALVRAGILRGDGWRDVAGFTDRFVINRKQPGVRVELVPNEMRKYESTTHSTKKR